MSQTTAVIVLAVAAQWSLVDRAIAELTAPEDSRTEFGYSLTPPEVHDGWISLFDGETTFGWSDGERAAKGVLTGGKTTMEFADCELRAEVIVAGKILVGKQEELELSTGNVRRTIEGAGRGSIRLADGVAIRSLSIRPLGLKTVFDGKSLNGWKRIQRTKSGEKPLATWSLEDSALHAVAGPEAMELVDSNYGDLVLQLAVKTHKSKANGGVFFRAIPGDFMNGYEAQIYNVLVENVPGGLLHVGTGGIDDRQVNRRLVSRDGELFTMTIMAVGPRICTWVNGYQVTDWVDTRKPHKNPREGRRVEPGAIQLQAHDPDTDLEFRNIRIGNL